MNHEMNGDLICESTENASSPCSSYSSPPPPPPPPPPPIDMINNDKNDCLNHVNISNKTLPGEKVLFTEDIVQGKIRLTGYRLILFLNTTAKSDDAFNSNQVKLSEDDINLNDGECKPVIHKNNTNGDSQEKNSHVSTNQPIINGHCDEKIDRNSSDAATTSTEAKITFRQDADRDAINSSNDTKITNDSCNGFKSVSWTKNGEINCSKIDLNHSSAEAVMSESKSNFSFNTSYTKISIPIGIIDCVEIRDGVTLHFLTKFIKCYTCDFESPDLASCWLKRITDAITYVSQLDHLFCFRYFMSHSHPTEANIHKSNHPLITNGDVSNGFIAREDDEETNDTQGYIDTSNNGNLVNNCIALKDTNDQITLSTDTTVISNVDSVIETSTEDKDSSCEVTSHVNGKNVNIIDEDKLSVDSSLSLISLGNLDGLTSNSALRVSTTSLTSNHSTSKQQLSANLLHSITSSSPSTLPLSSSSSSLTTTASTTTATVSPVTDTTNTVSSLSSTTVSTCVTNSCVTNLLDALMINDVEKCISSSVSSCKSSSSCGSILSLLLGSCLDRVTFEFNRMGFTYNQTSWRITGINFDYKSMPTYPQYLIVPKCIDDDTIRTLANFRAFKRIPTVVWRSRVNGCVIARSSQPEVGWFGWRCAEDEKIVAEMISASFSPVTFSSKKLLILDARSYAAAVANRAKGGGCECPEYYPVAEVQFMGLANIHSIRKSFQSIRYLCQFPVTDENIRSNLIDSSKWLHHISSLIKSALVVVKAISQDERPVLVHCSDGWDRTPQVISLAEILLDPFYRTFDGFQLLIQKEWIEFGHKFADRCGSAPVTDDSNERCPIFLQWIDCVHQIVKQYPSEFQFNLQLLTELIIHVHSCLFGTFTCNNMNERVIYSVNEKSHSFWTRINEDSSYFLNRHYSPTDQILQPQSDVVKMVFWDDIYVKHSTSYID